MATKSPSTCFNISGGYEHVEELNSRKDVEGAMAFLAGRGLGVLSFCYCTQLPKIVPAKNFTL